MEPEPKPKLIASVMELFSALDGLPPPSADVPMADVPRPVLSRIADAHQEVTEGLYIATGLRVSILSHALLRAMQMASALGITHSIKSAENVIDVATTIAMRMSNERNLSLPN